MSSDFFHQDEQLSEVLQQISGHLRVSLANIHIALNRLIPPELRDQQERVDLDAAVLCQSYYRILRLANNLSDASEPEKPVGYDQTNGDIVQSCRDVIERARVPAEMLDIQLEFRCAKEHHIIAMNRERIDRLLLNLLSNAFKFIGTGEKRVSLEVRIDPGYVYLSLTDTGRGIPPEMLDTVFDRCRQTNRLDPPPHGLGLGLPICRRIAQEHGGSLALSSELGKGTTVTVSLPNRRMTPVLKEPSIIFGTSGINPTLMELADALPKQAFLQKYLD